MIADVDIGILYVFALATLGEYGIVLGGWASGNKYGVLGALRAAAQMISYEVALGLIVIGTIILAGSLRLTDIVEAQQDAGSSSISPSPSSCTSWRGSPRSTGRPSTCPNRRASWPAASTSSTAA